MNPFMQVIAALGAGVMKIFGIEDPIPTQSVEMNMLPAEGRSYINFDNFREVVFLNLRSENHEIDPDCEKKE